MNVVSIIILILAGGASMNSKYRLLSRLFVFIAVLFNFQQVLASSYWVKGSLEVSILSILNSNGDTLDSIPVDLLFTSPASGAVACSKEVVGNATAKCNDTALNTGSAIVPNLSLGEKSLMTAIAFGDASLPSYSNGASLAETSGVMTMMNSSWDDTYTINMGVNFVFDLHAEAVKPLEDAGGLVTLIALTPPAQKGLIDLGKTFPENEEDWNQKEIDKIMAFLDTTYLQSETITPEVGALYRVSEQIHTFTMGPRANEDAYFFVNSLGGASVGTVPTPAVPIPSAVWLFGSGLIGLIGLIGITKRKKAIR